MIHYHGTPVTPRKHLFKLEGKNFCVSFAHPYDIEVVVKIGQSVMMDNGAFSAFTKNKKFNKKKYFAWVDKYLTHPHWAVIPDMIGGSVEDQKTMLSDWHFPKELSAPVFHLHLNLDYLLYLVDNYPKICLGSSEIYWKIGTESWIRRMDQIYETILKHRKYLPWIHGMRMLGQTDRRYPLASADSANVARNFSSRNECPLVMADRIDKKQPPLKYVTNPQKLLFKCK